MILQGNQRGGSRDLSQHLLKAENERVEIHELRGFMANDLHGALQESYAVSRATRCKQHLYSLSLNPPPDAEVDNAYFVKTINRVETELGLTDQPRAIVLHEKNGRRHAHAVWSRIDTERGRAVHLPYTKNKLQEISRDIYIERGWQMPRGFVDRDYVDPRNFTLAEWQQAKRTEKDPQNLKGLFQDSWAISDGQASFANALQERGFHLARGDRRGFVAVDHTGEVYSLSRWIGLKSKAIKERLGEPDKLPSVQQAHVQAARAVTFRLEDLKAELKKREEADRKEHAKKRAALVVENARAQTRLKAQHAVRAQAEQAMRKARHRTGALGLWDRLTGRRRKTERENQHEAAKSVERDRREIHQIAREFALAKTAHERSREEKQRRSETAVRELSRDINDLRARGQATPEPQKTPRRSLKRAPPERDRR